jgi:hypothetical protein
MFARVDIHDPIIHLKVTRGLPRPWELNIIYIHFGDPNPLVRWKGSIKQTLAKLCKRTFGKRTQLLPVTLLRIRNAPRAKIHLSPFEMLYRRPFLSNDLVMEPRTDSLLR